MKKRRRARELALQRLYSLEISGNSFHTVSKELSADCNGDVEIETFALELLRLCVENQEMLDKEVTGMVQNWEYKRIALVDRLILRLALCEMLYFNEIPPKVTMNEAIELAKMYSTEQSGRFVNGILDSTYKKYHSESRIHKTGRGLLT